MSYIVPTDLFTIYIHTHGMNSVLRMFSSDSAVKGGGENSL